MDDCVGSEEVLCLLGRFQLLHLSLSSSRRPPDCSDIGFGIVVFLEPGCRVHTPC